jgi:hypothetical protein
MVCSESNKSLLAIFQRYLLLTEEVSRCAVIVVKGDGKCSFLYHSVVFRAPYNGSPAPSNIMKKEKIVKRPPVIEGPPFRSGIPLKCQNAFECPFKPISYTAQEVFFNPQVPRSHLPSPALSLPD